MASAADFDLFPDEKFIRVVGDKTSLERTEGPYLWLKKSFACPPNELLVITLRFLRVTHHCLLDFLL